MGLSDYPEGLDPDEADALIEDLAAEPVQITQRELIVERDTGKVRQAGTVSDGHEQRYVKAKRLRCERDLYYFLRTVWNMHWLYPPLHIAVCRWLQQIPPVGKFLLMPRNHCKSTLVAQGIPPHALIQPKEHNVYFPGLPGASTRILMVGENEDRIADHYRPIKQAFEGNELLRALWPHLFWENPKHDAPLWNNTELIIRRDDNYPDPTIRAIGVGGATTGSHPNLMIKDDLTTEKAAREPTTMQVAIDWHKNSRALFEDPQRRLEYLSGTRWNVNDLAGHVLENDATVAVNTRWRTMIEDGQVIYPSKFGTDPERAWQMALEQYDGDFVMASLQYMNSVIQAGITDFDPADLRVYGWENEAIVFDEIDADARLTQEMRGTPAGPPLAVPRLVPDLRGVPLRDPRMDELRGKLLSDEKVVSAFRMRYLRQVRGY